MDSSSQYSYDVFLSYSTRDKDVVREIAERLKASQINVWFDEWILKPGDNIPCKIEEGLEKSRVLALFMSANAFTSDWAKLESGTFRFRDPLNNERRFIPVRIDNSPLKGSLAQFLYIDLTDSTREEELKKLIEACSSKVVFDKKGACKPTEQFLTEAIRLKINSQITAISLGKDGKHALVATVDGSVGVWSLVTGEPQRLLRKHSFSAKNIIWSKNERYALANSVHGSTRLYDLRQEKVFDIGRSKLTNAEMHLFRLSAAGKSPHDISRIADFSLITTNLYLHSIRKKLGWKSQEEFGKTVYRIYYEQPGPLKLYDIHGNWVPYLAWKIELNHAFNGKYNSELRLCGPVRPPISSQLSHLDNWRFAWSDDATRVLACHPDNTLALWNVYTDQQERIFEGHTSIVTSVAWLSDRLAVSASADRSIRLWDVNTGKCIYGVTGHDAPIIGIKCAPRSHTVYSADASGLITTWNFSEFAKNADSSANIAKFPHPTYEQVQYTNAKVLLVGESGVGKTGLSNYLAHGIKVDDGKPIPSTDGAWATHWSLRHDHDGDRVQREIWLWDFAGQVDYRLVHQLYMDDTAAAVLVFNPQSENPFEGLGYWDRDIQKSTKKTFAKLLAAGRIDRGGLVVSKDSVIRFMTERGFWGKLYETSAKTGSGCDELKEAILATIDWSSIPETTSPALYHRIKQEILNLRDSGLVLIRFSELKQRIELTLRDEDFELVELETVVDLLASPGMIQRLDFGGFILLRPEILSRYASAVVRKVRRHPQELGCIREDELLAGDLDYQDFERLDREDEAVVLRTLLETFISRAWCLRHPCEGSAVLTFPSYFRRERSEQPSHPNVLVTYRFDGPTDEIYATLVVLLHHTVAFESTALWKSAADFKTQTDANLGFALSPIGEGTWQLDIYFEPNVDDNSRVLFLRYIHDHLMHFARNVVRLRNYYCGNSKCRDFERPYKDQEAIEQAQAPNGLGKVFCGKCGKPIALRDAIEKRFDSDLVIEQVKKLEVEAHATIDNESRELILVGHAFSIVAEAGQIYRGYTNSDHGIDGEIEFKDENGNASGRRLYIQLKSGDSYLTKRKRDDADVFQIKNPRWAQYWQQQAYPVMLVIRTPNGEIRWMDVSAYLKRKGLGKQITQIIFDGENFDVMSVRRWRETVLTGGDSAPVSERFGISI